MHFRTTRAGGALAALLIAAALGGAGCGDDDSDSNASAPSEGASAESTSFDETVSKIVAEQTQPNGAKPPADGPPAQRGKRVVIVPVAGNAEGAIRVVRALDGAAKDLGWDLTVIDPQGDPAKMAAAVQKAVALKADGLITIAIDDKVIGGPLQQAKEQGIKLIGLSSDNSTGVYDWAFPDHELWENAGYWVAAAAYEEAGGEMRVLQFEDDTFGSTRARQVGFSRFIDECKENGGDCEVVGSAKFLITELATRFPQLVAAEARKHPDFKVLWLPYDAAVTPALAGLKAAGVVDKGDTFTISVDGNADNIELIRSGGYEKATWAFSATGSAYGTADVLNRLFAGESAPDGLQGVQYRLITQENAPESGVYDGEDDQRDAYRAIWLAAE